MSSLTVITQSARAICAVAEKKRAVGIVLDEAGQSLDIGEYARLQEIVYGSLRWYTRLDAIVNQILDRPFRSRDRDLHGLIIAGLYQLEYMRTPAHAVVSQTVFATRELKKSWAKGVVNHTLREYQRRRDEIANACDDPVFVHACPGWLVDEVRKSWPDNWQGILNNWNQRPPLSLRVNARSISRENYLSELHDHDIAAQPCTLSPHGVVLTIPLPVNQLPGFAEGQVSVQDEAAQLAVLAMDLQPGLRVLDACAAPGGKTCHLLECESELQELTALDLPGRITKIEQNCRRLKLDANIIGADALATDTWWDGELFDRILLDAPCTGTGVIRRHPDIKHQRRADDISQLANKQKSLLHTLWPLLATSGQLLYVTCSILPRENEQVVLSALEHFNDAKELPLSEIFGHLRDTGRQRLPGDDDTDGFYYALLTKMPGNAA
ncbi:MAG: 16S rRNA (cytosine(967)-C(5))-methyltransferase RsmB [Gammaproteobacteria bacterium]|nr:16S rRNA (cytosine(967)-C(5))-methyltransferase RsmB [Gammaproteobacteria bacterium]